MVVVTSSKRRDLQLRRRNEVMFFVFHSLHVSRFENRRLLKLAHLHSERILIMLILILERGDRGVPPLRRKPLKR